MRSKSFEIALSAIAAAIATLFLSLGVLSPFLLATGYIMGCFAMMLPLSRQFYWGDILAYAAAVILSLLLGGMAFFWRLLPFILFFGLHPLVNSLQVKYGWNRWIAFLCKAIWFDGAAYLVWRFVFEMTTNFAWVDEHILWVIVIGGTLFFYIYDRMIFQCQNSVNILVHKIKRN